MEKNHRLSFLFNNSVIYAFSNLLQRGLAFMLLPLYTRYFSKSEFGAMEQVYQMVMVLSIITSMGMPQGLVRGFYLDAKSETDQGKMLGALVAFLLPVTACIALILWIFSDFLSHALFRQEGYSIWIKLSVGFYIAILLQQLPMQLLKTRQQADRYAVWAHCHLPADCHREFILYHVSELGTARDDNCQYSGFWPYRDLYEFRHVKADEVEYRLFTPGPPYGIRIAYASGIAGQKDTGGVRQVYNPILSRIG